MKLTDKSLLTKCIKTHKGRFFSASEESKKSFMIYLHHINIYDLTCLLLVIRVITRVPVHKATCPLKRSITIESISLRAWVMSVVVVVYVVGLRRIVTALINLMLS